MFDVVAGRPLAATTIRRAGGRRGSEIEEVSRMHTDIGSGVGNVAEDRAPRTRSKSRTADLRTLCPALTESLQSPFSSSEWGDSMRRQRAEIRRHG